MTTAGRRGQRTESPPSHEAGPAGSLPDDGVVPVPQAQPTTLRFAAGRVTHITRRRMARSCGAGPHRGDRLFTPPFAIQVACTARRVHRHLPASPGGPALLFALTRRADPRCQAALEGLPLHPGGRESRSPLGVAPGCPWGVPVGSASLGDGWNASLQGPASRAQAAGQRRASVSDDRRQVTPEAEVRDRMQ